MARELGPVPSPLAGEGEDEGESAPARTVARPLGYASLLVVMGYLVAAVVLAVTFGLIQRAAQRRRVHYFHVAWTNYVVAALVALVWVAAQGGWEASALTYWVGALNGVGFAVLIVLQYFMLGTAGRGDHLCPRLAGAAGADHGTSLVVYGEPAEAVTLSGIALLVVAAPLIAYRRMPLLPAAKVGLYWAVVVGLLGFTAGTLVSWKVISEVTPAGDRGAFVLATFAGAMVTAGVTLAVRRWSDGPGPPLRQEGPVRAGWIGTRLWVPLPIVMGVGLGLCNVVQLWLFLAALREVPGAVAFPVHSAGTVLLITLAGWIVWRERHGPITLLGIAAALAGLVLVNL